MSRHAIIKCDRCKSKVDEDKERLMGRYEHGLTCAWFELCPDCARMLLKWIRVESDK